MPTLPAKIGILLLLAWPELAAASGEELLRLRREYNQVSAAIDTLVRRYGSEEVAALAAEDPAADLVPAGMKLVLIFWADDEARVFLNGHLLSSTRLTPVRVEIPSLYVRPQNLLRAHCWDTDRVESGFMAGLYLENGEGRLRRVLVSGEGGWRAGEGEAQEIFYAHSQPDIPGARVIWGQRLFGEVWLEARFGAATLQGARRRRASAPPSTPPEDHPMETHELLSRLARLQARQDELKARLEARRPPGAPAVRYKGYRPAGLVFSLGRAAPLGEEKSAVALRQLRQWAAALAAPQKDLVFRPARPLKGLEAMTEARRFEAGGGEEDRRADYRAPPENGPGVGRGALARVPVGREGKGARAGRRRAPARWWLALAALSLYTGMVGFRWWKLFEARNWRR